jgi:hypothetical protein
MTDEMKFQIISEIERELNFSLDPNFDTDPGCNCELCMNELFANVRAAGE